MQRVFIIRGFGSKKDSAGQVVDFERVYRSADGSQVRVPMCASALLSYRDGGFHLFHWHASLRGPRQLMPMWLQRRRWSS